MPLIIPRMFSFLFRFKSNSCEQRLIDKYRKTYAHNPRYKPKPCVSLPSNAFIC